MAEDTFKHIIIGFVLFTLFGVMIMTVVLESGTTYDKDLDEVAGGTATFTKFNNTASDIEESSKSMKAKFEKGDIFSVVAGVVVDGIFGVGLSMFDMIVTPFDILNDIMLNEFEIPPIVSSVILGVLVLSIIFAIWGLIKIGN